MPSTFPGAIDVFDPDPPVDGFDYVMASDIAQLQDAVLAVENALGENMQNVDTVAVINSATVKPTPVDTDKFGFWDSATQMLASLSWANIKAALKAYFDTLYVNSIALNGPEGQLLNGYISRTVTSNNLTVAIKTLSGADPSASNPVHVRIGNTMRTITTALSVTKNAGLNYCGAGGYELASQEVDYFVYLGYNATDGVVIGFSRIPWARTYGDFNTSVATERYCAISTITNAVSTDRYQVIGRFNATLSGSPYQWSIPNPDVVINYPIYQTRWLTWNPAYSASGSMTYTSVSTTFARYKVDYRELKFQLIAIGTTGGTASNILRVTVMFNGVNNSMVTGATLTGSVFGGVYLSTGSPGILNIVKYDLSNFSLGTMGLNTAGFAEI